MKNTTVKPGRLLWLRKKRPKDEPVQYFDVPKPEKSEPITTKQEPGPPSIKTTNDNVEKRTKGSTPPSATDNTIQKVTLFQYHPVREGETLSGIADFYGVSSTQLQEWNELGSSEEPKPGMQLRIKTDKRIQPVPDTNPKQQEKPLQTESKSTFTHKVQPGESLWAISQEYGITIKELRSLNALDGSSSIQPGQELILKVTEGDAENSTRKQKIDGSSNIHTVQPGESLWGLAQKYGVTVEELIAWNSLEGKTQLSVGQTIKVDTSPKKSSESQETTFIVKPGDNLYQVSEKFNMTVEELMKLNGLESQDLSVGQKLKVIIK